MRCCGLDADHGVLPHGDPLIAICDTLTHVILKALVASTTEVKPVVLSRKARGTTSQMPGHGLFTLSLLTANSLLLSLLMVV